MFHPSNHCGVKYLGKDKIVFEYYRRKSLASPLRREQKTKKELCQLTVCHWETRTSNTKHGVSRLMTFCLKSPPCQFSLSWINTAASLWQEMSNHCRLANFAVNI